MNQVRAWIIIFLLCLARKYSYRAIAYRGTNIGPSFIWISSENLTTPKAELMQKGFFSSSIYLPETF